MKKRLLIALTVVVSACSTPYKVAISDAGMAKEGDSLKVAFDITPGKFPSNSRARVTPVVYNGNDGWVALKPVILVGKKRNIYDKRTGEIADGDDRRAVNRKTSVIPYQGTIRYEDWMQYVSLAVEQVVEDCCTQTKLPFTDIAEPQLLYYKPTPRFSAIPLRYELTELEKYNLENPFLHPMEDYNKRYDILLNDREEGTSAVMFKVGSSVIDMGFEGNRETLDAITKAFDLIENEPNAVLKNIVVAGYASPEGSLAVNTRLAAQRAQAVKRYMQTGMKAPAEHIFEVLNGREDWDGLRNMVSKSEMPGKNEVIRIIDSCTMEQQQRKTDLKNLNGGAPYRYMLEHFYPKLRTGGYVQVYYEIDRKAVVAAAVTGEKDRIARIDPDSPGNKTVTAINKGLEAIVDHKFDEALGILTGHKDDPRAWNLIGTCHMMKGEYREADEYFLKAAEHGDEDAGKNLEQTGWARKVNKQTITQKND